MGRAYVVVWWCPVSGCGYRPPAGTDEYEALYAHLERQHGVTEKVAVAALNAVEHLHNIGRIEHAAGFRFRDLDIHTWPADDDAGKAVLARLRIWWNDEGGSVYVHGPVGTGKTGLAVGIAKLLLAESSVEFVNTRQLLAGLRSDLAAGGQFDLEQYIRPYADWLILDDLGAERPTEWACDTIATLVERHHAKDNRFVVTSNYAPSALIKRLGHNDATVGRRIVSRLVDGATVIKLDRADLRVRREPVAVPDDVAVLDERRAQREATS